MFVDLDFDGETRGAVTWFGADKQHHDPVKDLVTIEGYLTDGGTDTLKSFGINTSTVRLYADVTGKKIFDKIAEVSVDTKGYFKFDNVPSHTQAYFKTISGDPNYTRKQ